MPSYKFTYFDARGRGELCRYILHAAGQKFVDERLTGEQWSDRKAGKTHLTMDHFIFYGLLKIKGIPSHVSNLNRCKYSPSLSAYMND